MIEAGNRFLADTGRIGALAGDGLAAVGYFWSEALGWPLVWDQDEETAIQAPGGGTKITWGGPPVAGPLSALGARVIHLGVDRAELADPEGNEFIVRWGS